MALRRGINSCSVIHVCKEVGLFLPQLADMMYGDDIFTKYAYKRPLLKTLMRFQTSIGGGDIGVEDLKILRGWA
jgi:hypothetical protein